MKVTLGNEGLQKTWQDHFPEITKCCKCDGEARIGFVAHESIEIDDQPILPRAHVQYLCDMYENTGSFADGTGAFWLHDCCAVAVYFCKACLNPTALFNQA